MNEILTLAFNVGLVLLLALALWETYRQRRRQEAVAKALEEAQALIEALARSVQALQEALAAEPSKPAPRKKLDVHEEAARLAQAGLSAAEIARRLGIPREQAEILVRLARARRKADAA